MIAFLDSSTLVAGLWSGHTRHAKASRWLVKAKQGEIRALTSAHGIAETYAVLSGLPIAPRLHPTLVRQAIDDALTYVELAALTREDYARAIADAPDVGAIGGAVYDYLHIVVARQAACEAIITLNAKNFRRLCQGNPPRIVDAAE